MEGSPSELCLQAEPSALPDTAAGDPVDSAASTAAAANEDPEGHLTDPSDASITDAAAAVAAGPAAAPQAFLPDELQAAPDSSSNPARAVEMSNAAGSALLQSQEPAAAASTAVSCSPAAADTSSSSTITSLPAAPSETAAAMESAAPASPAAAAAVMEVAAPAVPAAAAAAGTSHLGSPLRSNSASSSSTSSRRGSRSRVGEASPIPPSQPPQQQQQLLQAQQLTLQQPQQQQQQPLLSTPGAPPAAAAAATSGMVTAQAAGVLAAGQLDATAALQTPSAAGAAAGAAVHLSQDQPCGVVAPSYRRSGSSSILSLHIHGTSQLVPDLLLTDPIIRLHVVHAATGEYVRVLQQLEEPPQQQQKQQQQSQGLQQQRARAGGASSSSSPGSRLNGGSSLPRARHTVSTDTQAELLEYPGRPALSTLDNNTPNPKPGLLEYIPAVQTRPFDITSTDNTNSCLDSSSSGIGEQQQRCGGGCDSSGSGAGGKLGLSACWEEQLCVDAAPEELVQSDAVLLLELMQLPGGFTRFKRHPKDFGKSGAGHSIAWAFLRLSGLQQKQLLAGQQPLKLRLQLYNYSPGAVRPEGLMSPRLATPHPESPAKAAYLSFKLSGFLPHPSSTSNPAAVPTTSSPAAHSSLTAVQQSSGSADPRSGSPWRAGLWTPWAPQGLGFGQNPGASSQMAAQALAAGASKYPAYVEVTLASVARPLGAVVVSHPAAGIRPALPAGYGSGFEIGRMPVSLLYMPRAMRGSTRGSAGGAYNTRGSAGGLSCADDAAENMVDEALLLLESRLHRLHTHACQVPNALLAEMKGTAGGCSAISISRDGRWLAAACGDDKGSFKVVLYQALTGRLCWVLGSHAGMVHSISWAKDDSAVVTASADFTAKVWLLPELPGPPASGDTLSYGLTRHHSSYEYTYDRAAGLHTACADQIAVGGVSVAGVASAPGSPTRAYMARQGSSAAVLNTGVLASLGATAAAAGVGVSVLQHTSFVYAAEMHPTMQPLPTVITAGFDGVLRLWSLEGVVLYSLQVSDVPVNCVAFDQLGTRFFAGDAAGMLTELSVDLTPLSAPGSTWSNTWSNTTQAGWASVSAAGAGSSSSSMAGSPSSGGAAGSGSGSAGAVSTEGLSTSGAGAGISSVLKHGSNALQQLAGAQLMRKLRVSQELAGSPIMSMSCHPGGHHLMALARSPKGVSDLVALDAKLLLVARRFTGIRCSNAPIKFAVSPDGHYILCGSEDGSTTIWDFATATPTPVPHFALGHAPIHSMAWSSCFQAVVVCSFSHYAPVRVLAFAGDQPQVVLNPPVQQHASSKVSGTGMLAMPDLHRPLRCPLPEQLTPAHVHALLSDLRLSASQRGLYQASDPNGQQLMVPARINKHLPRRLGSRPTTADTSSAGAGRQHTDRNSSGGPAGGSAGGVKPQAGSCGMLQRGEAGVAAAAASSQSGVQQLHGPLQSQKDSLRLQVAADGLQEGAVGLTQNPALITTQPGSPRVIDGTPRSGAAAVAAPWQS